MSYHVPRSRLGGVPNYEQIVEVLAKNLRDYAAHEVDVAGGRADPYPKPEAPPIVLNCIDANGFPDFVIVEDVAPSPPAHRVRRNNMINTVLAAAGSLINEISPPGRRALLALRYEAAKSKNGKTDADKAVIAQYEDQQRRIAAVNLSSAEAQNAIEDIAEPDLNSWTLPNLEAK